jgi:NCS1 family nucleobase:cation symporter-1
MDSTVAVLFALFVILLATLTTNVAANLVSPAYDLSNVAPSRISFRTGALIACGLGVVTFPWRLYEDPDIYIFTWLGTVGGLLGAVSGILLADYWLLRRTRLAVDDLYRAGGRYWYDRGWNWRALAAFGAGGLLAVGGSHSGPYPSGGLIPVLKPLADYGWAVGLAVALGLYVLLMRVFPPAVPADAPADAS